jgi:hypothetical protein
MRKLIASGLVVSLLTGCASTFETSSKVGNSIGRNEAQHVSAIVNPVYKLNNYSGPDAMDRNEAIQAAKQCLFAKMRPNVEYISVRTDTGSKVMVPVNVHCEPYLQ